MMIDENSICKKLDDSDIQRIQSFIEVEKKKIKLLIIAFLSAMIILFYCLITNLIYFVIPIIISIPLFLLLFANFYSSLTGYQRDLEKGVKFVFSGVVEKKYSKNVYRQGLKYYFYFKNREFEITDKYYHKYNVGDLIRIELTGTSNKILDII